MNKVLCKIVLIRQRKAELERALLCAGLMCIFGTHPELHIDEFSRLLENTCSNENNYSLIMSDIFDSKYLSRKMIARREVHPDYIMFLF